MNLSFSTRGWDMTWPETLDAAQEMRFSGIELYDIFGKPELIDKGGPLHKYAISATVRELREKQLAVPCVDAHYDLSTADDAVVDEICRAMNLTGDLRAPYLALNAKTDIMASAIGTRISLFLIAIPFIR